MRALSVVFALATALARLESLPLAQDVTWFTSPERAAWSTAKSPTVCALDAFHFGVQFTAPTRAQYRENKWQLVANKVEGWENGVVVASGLLKVTLLDSKDQKEEGNKQELGQNGIKCEFDPQFCAPKLVNIRLPGVDPEIEDGPSLQKDHVMELEFQQPTNRPDASSKQLIDQLVDFTEYIGDELVGTWSDDGRVLVIRVVQIDEEKVKPVKQLMQGLLRTGLYPKESNIRVDEIGTFEGGQSLRIEPPGTYLIRVLIADEIAIWSPEVSVKPCDASYIVVDPRRASQDTSIDASEKRGAIQVGDTTPSFAIDGVLTHGAQGHCPAPVSAQQNVGLARYFLEKSFNSNALSAGKALALLVDVAGDWNNSEVARFEPFTTGLLHFAAARGEKDAFAILGRRYHQNIERSNHGLGIAVYHYFHAAVEAAAEFHQLGKQPLHEMTRLYDSFERDVTVGERGDDDELIQFQKMRADKEGDVGAMAAMGDLYYWGAHGIPRDHAQAYSYFNRAAQAGDVNSQSAVAGMLLKGEGTAQDNVTAIKWYEKAAEKNHTRALNGLGFIHFHGSGGVPENKSFALEYFERAAENQEDGDSVFNAGYCHAMGLGTNVNVSRAMEFYDVAARKFGHFDAIFEMGKILMKGVQGVVPRDTKKALQYLKAASDGGQWGRAVRRGFDLYTNGQFDRAAVSYHEARELGYPVATSNLAFLYDQRLLRSGDVASERRALKYLSLASEENGDRETLVRIGDYHYYGLAGLRKDPQTAIRWYSRASAAGVEAGAYNVGQMYEFGDGVEVNLDRARRYYDRVLELSSGSAEIHLVIRFALARLSLRRWLQGTRFEALLGLNSPLGTGTNTNMTTTDSTSMLDAATRSLDSKIYAIISTAAIIILSIGVWYFHSAG
ncbi:hypothetical protein PR003_g23866 [Phytophthora rubi]|uniref:Uncharacterized protein n=1 Tax=Phytophthora rubi TaxID=129364 RepID=A0A6A4D1A1_9STRA|nr:hypothetical protein PR003_g23866 [Phytophthora rubi]